MIGIIAYGAGNQASVQSAFSRCGQNTCPVAEPNDLLKVSKLVLPGVGHFGALMRFLALKKLDEALVQWVNQGKPLLGICLGMQAFFARSEEAPGVCGLGLLEGTLQKFDAQHRCPHMGWNTVVSQYERTDWMYFAHSYFAPKSSQAIAITSHGVEFASIVRVANATGYQFHPERSGKAGHDQLAAWSANAR